jgi:hypothetical protein
MVSVAWALRGIPALRVFAFIRDLGVYLKKVSLWPTKRIISGTQREFHKKIGGVLVQRVRESRIFLFAPAI